MRLAIDHVTEYRLERAARFVLQQVRLTALSDAGQKVVSWNVRQEGGALQASFDDHHGNRTLLFSREGGDATVRLHVEGAVETAERSGVVGHHRGPAPLWIYRRETPLTKAGDGVRAIMGRIGEGDAIERLHALNAAVADAVRYESGCTDVGTTAEAAIAAGCGVCQDQAHVFASAARLLGFPARYVSGYLWTEDSERYEASHAWAEAHVEGLGWVGFDPANRQSPDERYVRLAQGLDYADAAPVKGVRTGAGAEALVVSVQIQQ